MTHYPKDSKRLITVGMILDFYTYIGDFVNIFLTN